MTQQTNQLSFVGKVQVEWMDRETIMKNLMWFLGKLPDEKLARVLWYTKKIL